MRYICEGCGRIFDDIKSVEECEKKHEEERMQTEELKKQQQNRYDEIKYDIYKLNEKIRNYLKDYGTFSFQLKDKDYTFSNLVDLFLNW